MEPAVNAADDTSKTIEIPYSGNQLLIIFGVGVALTAASAAIAFDWLPSGTDRFDKFWGWIGMLFFGPVTLVVFWRLISAFGPIVTVSPEGLQDTRVAAEPIPWKAIEQLSTWGVQGVSSQRCLVVKVDPAAEQALTLTVKARTTKGANKALRADGLCVTITDLDVEVDDFIRTVAHYAQRYGVLKSATVPHYDLPL